ncbi:hypothetical protein J437_LFUL018369, partial [Ladona fulva]
MPSSSKKYGSITPNCDTAHHTVWDLGSSRPTLEHTIHTIASVGRVKWRPGRKYHIASCALVVDCSISVWDVRRPYIPFAAFNEHKDVATGIAWKGDPHVFLSTSRDCVLYQHDFQDATRPSSKANPQGICFNTHGDLSYACRVNFTSSFSSKISGILSLLWNVVKVLYTSCISEKGSSIGLPPSASGCAEDGHSGSSALVLAGETGVSEGMGTNIMMSERGIDVVPEGGSETVSVDGITIDTGADGLGGECGGPTEENDTGQGEEVNCTGNTLVPGPVRERAASLTSIASGLLCLSDPEVQPSQGPHPPLQEYGEFFYYVEHPVVQSKEAENTSKGTGEDGVILQEEESDKSVEKMMDDQEVAEKQAECEATSDITLVDEVVTSEFEDSKERDHHEEAEDDDDPWDLPLEALPICSADWDSSSGGAPDENPLLNGFNQPKSFQGGKPEGIVGPPPAPLQVHPSGAHVTIQPWDPSPSLQAALELCASAGDVQTVSSILLALGSQRHDVEGPDGLPVPHFDENDALHEHWLLAYLDFLGRQKLWDTATQ